MRVIMMSLVVTYILLLVPTFSVCEAARNHYGVERTTWYRRPVTPIHRVLRVPHVIFYRESNRYLRSSNGYMGNPKEKQSPLARSVRELKDFVSNLENVDFRRQLIQDARSALSSTIKNIGEGEVGKRGEELVFIQFAILSLIIFGIPPLISLCIKLLGFASLSYGGYFLVRSLWDLGTRRNLTPFVSPVAGNTLVTGGIYEEVRHPMYSGLIFFCSGLSVINDSIDKAVLTAVLAFFLDKKADKEEQMLTALHPLTYRAYVERTKKLLPNLY
jgi:protein-S-isoprenylcysteine O-methyltransferase Ste14